MKAKNPARSAVVLCFVVLLSLAACNKKKAEPDHPRLTPKVVMRDITFHSAALNRDMQYRVILPASVAAGQKLPVIYLLHGGGGGFHDWSNYSDVARYAEHNLILVIPEGNTSYYTNSAQRRQITIPLCSPAPPILQKSRTFFSPAANRKACCPQTAPSQRCWPSANFNMSSTLLPAIITGTSGTSGCPASFKACSST